MPTIKEIIAKREELKATNPNATNVDARKSLMQAPQKGNAPVAGQAPAPMPTEPTPVNVNEQQRMDNQTKRQDMIAQGQVPAVGQNPTTGTGVDGVTVDANGNISNTTGKRQKIKNMSGQEFYVDADQAQMQQSFGTPGYGQGTTTPSGATLNANGTISQGSSTKTALEQSIEDAKNGVIRQPEYYNNLTNGTNSPVNEEIKAKNEAQMALNKQQAELRTQERQQIAKEQPVPSQDQIFTSLKQGVPVGDPKSLDFRQAQARVNTFKKFSTYDTASLATSLSSGDLLVGTKAYNDLVSDPNMAIKIQKAMAFNKGEVDLVKTGETQMANVLSQNPAVATALSDGYMSKEEYDQLTNNDEVSAQGKLVEEKKTKYETIKAQYDAVEDDVNTEFEGKEVTDSFKAKIVADRRKGMYKDYQIASLEYQNSLGTYTNLKADATALLAQNMELYKEQKAQEAEIAKEQRAIDNSLALSQMQFDQKIDQQTQMMNDPTTAISTMIEEYKKLGIPFTRSTQQIIQDFESSGQDLGTYLTELQKTIQSKPEYVAMAEYNKRLLAPEVKAPTTPFELKELGGKTYKFNQQTGDYEIVSQAGAGGDLRYLADQFPNQAWAKNNNPAGITWNANFDNGTGTAKLLQDAGIQFTKGTARPANEGGNYVTFATIEDGLKAQQIIMSQTYGDSTVGQMLSKWVGTSEGPNYAKQVAGMAGITDLNSKVSSLTPEQMSSLQMAKIKKESPGLYGILSQGQGTQGVSTDAQNYFNLIQKGTTSYEDVFKKLGGSKVGQALMNEINTLISEKGGAVPALPESEQVKKMDDLIGRLDTLLEDEGNKLEAVSGLTYGSLWDKTLGYSKEQALGNLKFVLKGNTLQQLIDAKAAGATFGALSNEELRMLQESASPLLAFAEEDESKNIKGFKVDEATLKAEVKKLRDLFKEKREKMVNPGITTGISTQFQTPTQTATGQTSGGTTYQGYTFKPIN